MPEPTLFPPVFRVWRFAGRPGHWVPCLDTLAKRTAARYAKAIAARTRSSTRVFPGRDRPPFVTAGPTTCTAWRRRHPLITA